MAATYSPLSGRTSVMTPPVRPAAAHNVRDLGSHDGRTPPNSAAPPARRTASDASSSTSTPSAVARVSVRIVVT